MPITLKDLKSHNIETHVDEIMVKTRQQETLLLDLSEAFDSLCTTMLKLNLKKCIFGVLARKLLGFLVSNRDLR